MNIGLKVSLVDKELVENYYGLIKVPKVILVEFRKTMNLESQLVVIKKT